MADSRHTLFVHSFKGYGLNDAYDRAIALLLSDEQQKHKLVEEARRKEQQRQQQQQEREQKQQEREREREQKQKQKQQEHQQQKHQQHQEQHQEQQQEQQRQGQQQQQQQGEQKPLVGAAPPPAPSLAATKDALLAASIASKLPVTEASSNAASQQAAAGSSHAAATLASAAAIATQQQAQQQVHQQQALQPQQQQQQQHQDQQLQLQLQQSQQQQLQHLQPGKAQEEGPRQLAAGQAQATAEAQVQADAQALSSSGRSLLLGLAQLDSAATAAAARQLLHSLSGPALDPRLQELEARLFGEDAAASGGGSGAASSRPGGRSLQAAGGVLPLPTPSALPLVRHPCLFGGYNASYQRLPQHGQAPEPAAVQLVGEPDPDRCLELARRVVNASTGCIKPPCTLGTPTPALSGQFTALTGFYVVWSFLKIRQGAPVGELLPASRAYCRKPWQEAHAGAWAAPCCAEGCGAAGPRGCGL